MSSLKEVNSVDGGTLHLPETKALGVTSSSWGKYSAWVKFIHRATAGFQLISLLLIGYLILQNPFRSPAMEASPKQELKSGENSYSLDFVLHEPELPVWLLVIWGVLLLAISILSAVLFGEGEAWFGVLSRNDVLCIVAVVFSFTVTLTALLNLGVNEKDPEAIMRKTVMSKLPSVELVEREKGVYESAAGDEEPKKFIPETSLEHLEGDRYRFTVELPREIFQEQNAELKKKPVEEKVYTVEESNR